MQISTTYNYRDKSRSFDKKIKKNLCQNPASVLLEDKDSCNDNFTYITS